MRGPCASQNAKANREKGDEVRQRKEEARREQQRLQEMRKKQLDDLKRLRSERDQEAVERLRKKNEESTAQMRQQRLERQQKKAKVRTLAAPMHSGGWAAVPAARACVQRGR